MSDPKAPQPPASGERPSTFTFGEIRPAGDAPAGPAPHARPGNVRLHNNGRRPTDDERAAIQSRRAEIANRHRGEGGRFAAADDKPAAPRPPREPIDTIELDLPNNGLHVKYGPPMGVSLNLRIADLLGDDTNATKVIIVRTLLCVREVDGKPAPAIGTMVDVQKLANMIGDDGIDALYLLHNATWPPLTVLDLPAIKKNPRQS
jgi:hypothetical protein